MLICWSLVHTVIAGFVTGYTAKRLMPFGTSWKYPCWLWICKQKCSSWRTLYELHCTCLWQYLPGNYPGWSGIKFRRSKTNWSSFAKHRPFRKAAKPTGKHQQSSWTGKNIPKSKALGNTPDRRSVSFVAPYDFSELAETAKSKCRKETGRIKGKRI